MINPLILALHRYSRVTSKMLLGDKERMDCTEGKVEGNTRKEEEEVEVVAVGETCIPGCLY